MNLEARRTLARQYLDNDHLVEHHLRTFNEFLDSGIHRVVEETDVIEVEIGDNDGKTPFVAIDGVRVASPRKIERDGDKRDISPAEARQRNLTYAGPLFLNLRVGFVGESEEKSVTDEGEIQVGELPIMVRSNQCNLDGSPDEELIELGEDPKDPGGYFIVNGSERVLLATEDLATNTIHTEIDNRYQGPSQVAKTYSHYRGYRSLITVEYQGHSSLTITFPPLASGISFPILVRALGLETDREVFEQFSTDTAITSRLLPILERSSVNSQDAAIETIGERVAPNKQLNDQINIAHQILDERFLPHLNRAASKTDDWKKKANHLCRMAEACFELSLERREPTDKDHYANKRLRTAGDLMESAFRSALNRFRRDLRYQVKKSVKRSGSLTLTDIVNTGLLTDRIERNLRTGNWVGGRSGVSQLVDRTNSVGVISHLRRIQSPLSRSQPHFEARDLHGTQWGRICPSETPEGQNCGLIKHMAGSLEISEGESDIDELHRKLRFFGVKRPSNGD